MRILHFSAAGLPGAVGGRDVFMHELAKAMAAKGIEVRAAFHQTFDRREPIGEYEYDELRYHVLPPIPEPRRRSAIYSRTPSDAPGFVKLVDDFQPDVVHFHDSSTESGILHLRLARERQVKTAMTYHSPGQSCPQRELLFRGETPCDGMLRVRRCSECRLACAGTPKPLAKLISHLPIPLIGVDVKNGLLRLLTVRRATRISIDSWSEMIGLLDLLHCHASWVERMLRSNGVPPEKLRMYRTGLPRQSSGAVHGRSSSGPLRISFLGRCEAIKGIGILIEAVQRLPNDAPIVVSFFGPNWDQSFGKDLLARVAHDPRFRPPSLVAPSELHRVWSETDVLAVPSIWLETGPLVVLEAFAAGIPVIGSNLGGIAELVQDGVNGLLHEPGNAAALAACLSRLIEEPCLLDRLRAGIATPRTLEDLADDLIPEFERLMGSRSLAPVC